MPTIRRTIQTGMNAWIEEVRRRGAETEYFVGCTRSLFSRTFDRLPEAEAYWGEAESGALAPDLRGPSPGHAPRLNSGIGGAAGYS
jgi:hypothetical protein